MSSRDQTIAEIFEHFLPHLLPALLPWKQPRCQSQTPANGYRVPMALGTTEGVTKSPRKPRVPCYPVAPYLLGEGIPKDPATF